MEGSSAKKFSVIVISPLNALIRDQIVKIREAGLNVCMVKGDRVTGDDGGEDVSLTVPLETLLNTSYDLLFPNPAGGSDRQQDDCQAVKKFPLLSEKYVRLLWMKLISLLIGKHLL